MAQNEGPRGRGSTGLVQEEAAILGALHVLDAEHVGSPFSSSGCRAGEEVNGCSVFQALWSPGSVPCSSGLSVSATLE